MYHINIHEVATLKVFCKVRKEINWLLTYFYQNIPLVFSYLYSDWQALGCHIWPEMRLEESWFLFNVLIHSRLFFVQDKFVASMTTGHCACLVNRKRLKNKTQIVKKKTFRKKFINKSEYIRNKQDNFQIPYVIPYRNLCGFMLQMTLLIIFLFLLEKLFVQFSHFLFLIIEISFEITSKRVTMLSNKE